MTDSEGRLKISHTLRFKKGSFVASSQPSVTRFLQSNVSFG